MRQDEGCVGSGSTEGGLDDCLYELQASCVKRGPGDTYARYLFQFHELVHLPRYHFHSSSLPESSHRLIIYESEQPWCESKCNRCNHFDLDPEPRQGLYESRPPPDQSGGPPRRSRTASAGCGGCRQPAPGQPPVICRAAARSVHGSRSPGVSWGGARRQGWGLGNQLPGMGDHAVCHRQGEGRPRQACLLPWGCTLGKRKG